MELKQVLENQGLQPKETSTYLALLELGECTVAVLSKRAGLKRPTTYTVLEALEKKGYATKSVVGGATYFYPEHPKKLLTEAQLHLADLQQVLPQLESLFQKDSSGPRVIIYQGQEDLDRAYDESFIATGEILYMSTVKLSQAVFKKTFQKMDQVPLREDYRMRELVDESPEGQTYAARVRSQYRQVRIIPAQLLPFEVDIGVFGKKVLITSLQKNLFTVSIESQEINQAFRILFEGLWALSKE